MYVPNALFMLVVVETVNRSEFGARDEWFEWFEDQRTWKGLLY